MEIELLNGGLKFTGLDKGKLKRLYNKFRVDLLDSNIPHYRPVAFKMEGPLASSVDSNISKIPGFGYSFTELSFIMNNIIVSQRRGEMPTKLQASAALTKLSSDCTYITLNGKSISTSDYGSIMYTGEGMTSTPEMLLTDLTVFKQLKENMMFSLILMKGKGKKDFTDNQRLINNTDYKSMRTNYNLYEFFTVQEYLGGDKLKLNYLEDINEKVLEEILQDYFKQDEVIECIR